MHKYELCGIITFFSFVCLGARWTLSVEYLRLASNVQERQDGRNACYASHNQIHVSISNSISESSTNQRADGQASAED